MSIFKNIVTLGGHSRLQKDIADMKNVQGYYGYLYADFNPLVEAQNRSFQLLKQEREAAVKNLFLVKTLIFKIKKNVSDQTQKIILDESTFVADIDPSIRNSAISGEVSVNFEEIGTSFLTSVESSLSVLNSKEKITKNDLQYAAISVGIEVLGNFINEIAEINKQVTKQRELVKAELIKLRDAISKITEYHTPIFYETLRAIEIAEALNKTNQVFTAKFLKLNEMLFTKSKFKLFWDEVTNKKLELTEEETLELLILKSICSQYNQINKQKIESI